MSSHNLLLKNSSSDGKVCSPLPMDQTFPSPNRTRFFSSNPTRNPGEIHIFPTIKARNLNQRSGMKGREFAETSRSYRIRNKMPNEDQDQLEILDGEPMNGHSTSLVSNQEEFPERKVLGKEVSDPRMILWPPMVIVQNTLSHMDENNKWVGMTNKKLARCFQDYNFSKIKSAYGPGGHRGFSLLIFPSSVVGFLEAECLNREFLKKGRGKSQWENLGSNAQSDGDRQLYCYMATEEDIKLFNKHSKGTNKQKYEIKPYKLMIVDPSRNMEQNDQKLRKRNVEIQTIRQRACDEIEELKNEVECLDRHHTDTIKQLIENLENFEREHDKMQKSSHMLPNLCNAATPVA